MVWLRVLRKVVKEAFAYMLTLAIVFFAYAVSEYLGGNGALASLIFGIVLGNERVIFEILKRRGPRSVIVDAGLRRFEEEIAFFIRSFFLVYLGLMAVTINIKSVFWGMILSFLLLLVRYVAVRFATIRSPLREECPVMSVVFTRGLVAAIIATMPMQHGLLYADLYLNITIVVIITTAIFCIVGMFVLSRARK